MCCALQRRGRPTIFYPAVFYSIAMIMRIKMIRYCIYSIIELLFLNILLHRRYLQNWVAFLFPHQKSTREHLNTLFTFHIWNTISHVMDSHDRIFTWTVFCEQNIGFRLTKFGHAGTLDCCHQQNINSHSSVSQKRHHCFLQHSTFSFKAEYPQHAEH